LDEIAPPGHLAAGEKPRYCDEPLVHQQYINGGDHWKQEGFGRREAWETASKGDVVLLYSTSDVSDEYGACLSHLLRVDEKEIDEVGARLFFDEIIERHPKISYQEIQHQLDAGGFSERMRYCGQQGFSITRVEQQDLDTVCSLTDLELEDIRSE
jgi:hypothetical protein